MSRLALGAVVAVVATACGGGEAPPAEPADTTRVTAAAPPSTDIWLARLVPGSEGLPTVEDPLNVTARPGYDNQPAFLPDGSAFLYTVVDGAGQADIWLHDVAQGVHRPLTGSAPESEYSGTPLPGGGGFSAIRVEADSTQRLWRFDADGSGGTVVLPDVAPVGYHAWVGTDTLVLFVLGDPATLQVASVTEGTARVVASDIGRSIQNIPGTRAVSYVQRRGDGEAEIRRLDPGTGADELIAPALSGGDFHAWTPGGVLLQADGPFLFGLRPGVDATWVRVADLSALGIRLSRLAVHPGGSFVALVGEADGGV